MCGIIGYASKRHRIDIDRLATLRDLMTHRGPDAAGVWSSPDGVVALGHRRLAIIDLSPAGVQPMTDAEDTVCITFNGEIYNFQEIKAELSSLGHRFRSHSDTEVILESYKRWGTDCLKRLHGMFAFALYDKRQRRVFAARDRAGEKPFFFTHQNGSFAFASELKSLIRMPGFERRLNWDAVNCFFAFGYVPGDRCIFQGAFKLLQGEALVYDVDADSLNQWRYWQLPERGAAKSTEDTGELLEQLDGLLAKSVRGQLISDVPVGVLLSGGLDSSLVTAMAARAGSRLRTFTVTFPGHGVFDEARHAKLVANHFGTDHMEISPSSATIDLLPALARQYDEPIADSSMIPTHLISREIKQHASVALGGDGGDELFGGYTQYNRVRQASLMRQVLPRFLCKGISHAASKLPAGFKGRGFLLSAASSQRSSIARVDMTFNAEFRQRLLNPEVFKSTAVLAPETFKENLAGPWEEGVVDAATRVDFQTYLVDDILVKVDRASMLASLEVRAPFLDPAVIEFAFRLPDRLRANLTERKILLRLLAKRVLPKGFDSVRKQGFSIPAGSLQKARNESWDQVLDEADERIFNRQVIKELQMGTSGGWGNEHRLFSIVIFELWRREYLPTI